MSELTEHQILDMTETIAEAAWPGIYHNDGEKVCWHNEIGGLVVFKPLTDWNDFHRACDALWFDYIELDSKRLYGWSALIGCRRRPTTKQSSDPNKQTAAFLALHEFAKWKLEASK